MSSPPPASSSNNTATLERDALDAESNGRFLDALVLREKLLVAQQRLHGDPSPETDAQKVRFAELTLLWAGEAEANESPVDQSALRSKPRLDASRARSPKRQPGLTKPAKQRPPSASAARHKNCGHSDQSATAAADSSANAKKIAAARLAADGAAARPTLFADLSVASCVAVAEQLLSVESTSPDAQHQVALVQLRGKLLMAQVGFFHRANRPRAAVPVLHRAITHLERAAKMVASTQGGDAGTIELAQAYLTLCVLQSNANHHEDALRAAHAALAMVLVVEEQLWLCDPLRAEKVEQLRQERAAAGHHGGATGSGAASPVDAGASWGSSSPPPGQALKQPASSSAAAGGRPPRPSSAGAQRPPSAGPVRRRPSPELAPHEPEPEPPRETVYCGHLQAACYHNLGVQQQRLGMGELALDTYLAGYEVAFLTLGEVDPLTQRLQQCYAELFTSLNVRHFGPADSMQRPAVRRAVSNPSTAIQRLRTSYESSMRHHGALQAESKRQQRLLRPPSAASGGRAGDRTNASMRSRPQSAMRRMNRPVSATSMRSDF